MKAVILAQVSSKEQEENNSIPSQTRRLQEYASRMGFDTPQIFQLVESSTKSNRKQFSEMIAQIKRSKTTTALLADTIDRVQRSFKESVMLDELRLSGKVELHFVRENLVINKNSNSADILRWDMGVMFAKSYVTQLSDNVKRGLEQKRLNGEWSGRPPFGYITITKQDGKVWVIPDEERSDAARAMFEWYATASYSIKQIRTRLSDEYGFRLSTAHVHRILANPFYAGTMRIRGNDYPHNYTPLITGELQRQVIAVMSGFNKKPHKYAGLPYFYRGLIVCSECGCSITPEASKGYVYYHCTQYRGKHGARYVREEELTKQLLRAFTAIQPSSEQYEQAFTSLKASHTDKMKYRAKHLSLLQTELSRVETRLEKACEAHWDGKIDEGFFNKKTAEYKSTKATLTKKLASLDEANSEYYETLEKIIRICKSAPETFESSKLQERRELLNLVLQNLQLDGDQLRWQYKKPFDLMASCNEMNSWRRERDSNPR